MKILGTGLSGLVGSRVMELMSLWGYTFDNLSLETGVDITQKASVEKYFTHSDAPWVFHMAAYTDVQGAEKERLLGQASAAWKVNVAATENIVENCQKTGKRILYIDTDYAFDGKKLEYTEDDTPNPLGWYAKTKYEGAKRVLAMGEKGLVIRIANPYRAHPVGKKDFVHKMLERLMSGQKITAPADQLFAPTFIDDIAYALQVLLQKNSYGIYHVVGSDPLSPYNAALVISDIFGCDKTLIDSTKFADMFRDRAPAPQWAALKNDKISKLGVRMSTFKDGVLEVKKQESVIK